MQTVIYYHFTQCAMCLLMSGVSCAEAVTASGNGYMHRAELQ